MLARAAAHPGQLNRATLARQLLLGREPLGVVEAVRRIVAVQAQEAASPYLALWNRVAGFDPADLDAAFADHSVVKATLMRITLHAVAADDHPDLAPGDAADAAGGPAQRPALQGHRPDARRRRRASCRTCSTSPPSARTNAELDAWFEARFGALAEAGTVVGAAVGRPGRARPDGRSLVVRARARRTSRHRPRRPPHDTRAVGAATSCGATSRASGRPRAKDIASFGLLVHADGAGRARRRSATRWSSSRAPAATDAVRRPGRRPPRRRTRRRRRG